MLDKAFDLLHGFFDCATGLFEHPPMVTWHSISSDVARSSMRYKNDILADDVGVGELRGQEKSSKRFWKVHCKIVGIESCVW